MRWELSALTCLYRKCPHRERGKAAHVRFTFPSCSIQHKSTSLMEEQAMSIMSACLQAKSNFCSKDLSAQALTWEVWSDVRFWKGFQARVSTTHDLQGGQEVGRKDLPGVSRRKFSTIGPNDTDTNNNCPLAPEVFGAGGQGRKQSGSAKWMNTWFSCPASFDESLPSHSPMTTTCEN